MKPRKKKGIHIKIDESMADWIDSIFPFHGGMTLAVNRGLEILKEQVISGKLNGTVPILGGDTTDDNTTD